MFRRLLVFVAVLAVPVALTPSIALAQVGAGAVSGTIRDSLGGSIPGATVKIVNEDSGVVTEFTTDEGGGYRA